MERHGLTRKQPRTGGSIIFLVAIGAVVAAAGIAGLRYRDQLWDDTGHPDHVATSQEAATGVPVTLTNAEEVAKEQSALLAPALSTPTTMIIGDPDAPTLDAGKPPTPKPAAAAWKPKPKPTPKPENKENTATKETKDPLPSESEIFSKPE